MIAGFRTEQMPGGGVMLNVAIGGSGPPLVLLHGYPQTHLAWHRVAPAFARDFTVIAPDLRGYGASDAPADDPGHTMYAKRAMAADIVALLDHLGMASAGVLGHDRGARVAYRMALDHPGRVSRLGIVEVVPTGDMWHAWDAEMALSAYHWTFLAQPAPLPERLIGADPDWYCDWTLASWSGDGTLSALAPEALESYRAQMRIPARVAAMCADYRAGATTDRALDAADRAAGRRIACPVALLTGRQGFPARSGDPARLWRAWSDDVTAETCGAGHFVMEEAPEDVLRFFSSFFAP